MISVGIDVSKDKSMVCILKPYGEVLKRPFEIYHTENGMELLKANLKILEDEFKVVLEATGHYHLPVLQSLIEEGYHVTVVNPLIMKKFISVNIRKGKNDKIDSFRIAEYGISNWFDLQKFEIRDSIYDELNILSRQYIQYNSIKIKCKITLDNLLDKTMPGIKKILHNSNPNPQKDKLNSFVMKYWHYDNITNKSEKQFIRSFLSWTKKEGYQQSTEKAKKIYALACNGIPTMKSTYSSTQMLVQESVRTLREVEVTLFKIFLQMDELAKKLKEYEVVRSMNGVGEKLAVRLIAEIGDINRFHSSKALIAFAGIDAPPFQSGNFVGTKRHISKRGSKYLRKTGYEVMQALKSTKPEKDNAVYEYILKKEREGKPLKVAKIAGLNKFLRIYYARVSGIYN